MANVNDKAPINLVLCFDGTGNAFHGSDEDTNVVKLLSKLHRSHPQQYHYYQSGIGTYEVNETSVNKSVLGSIKGYLSMALDQGVGTTFDAHVIAGYKFLMRYYEDGARIYMFGFSRGAFTAIYLAQMINTVGLLCKGNEEMVSFAYRLYQDYYQEKAKLRDDGLHNQSEEKEEILKHDVKHMVIIRDHLTEANKYSGCGNDPKAYDSGKELDDDASSVDETTPLRKNANRKYDGQGQFYANEGLKNTTKNATDLPSNKIEREKRISAAAEKVKTFSRTFCRKELTAMGPESDDMDVKNIKVHFLGLWDCVASVALLETRAYAPLPCFGTAKYVRHAVAIDENRVKFRPWLLSREISSVRTLNENTNGKKKAGDEDPLLEALKGEDIREVWFPGSHCDVGGGWPANNGVEMGNEKSASWWDKVKYFWSGSRSTEPSNNIQMSDVSLAWMMDEIRRVDEREAESSSLQGMYWNQSRDVFEKRFSLWKQTACSSSEEADRKRGLIHHPLQFNRGTGFPKVLLWKLLEYLPFIPRCELRDNHWQYTRIPPNLYRPRYIPWGAVLHESVFWRGETYQPKNAHDRGWPPCMGPDDRFMKHEEWSDSKKHKLWTFQYRGDVSILGERLSKAEVEDQCRINA